MRSIEGLRRKMFPYPLQRRKYRPPRSHRALLGAASQFDFAIALQLGYAQDDADGFAGWSFVGRDRGNTVGAIIDRPPEGDEILQGGSDACRIAASLFRRFAPYEAPTPTGLRGAFVGRGMRTAEDVGPYRFDIILDVCVLFRCRDRRPRWSTGFDVILDVCALFRCRDRRPRLSVRAVIYQKPRPLGECPRDASASLAFGKMRVARLAVTERVRDAFQNRPLAVFFFP